MKASRGSVSSDRRAVQIPRAPTGHGDSEWTEWVTSIPLFTRNRMKRYPTDAPKWIRGREAMRSPYAGRG